MIGQQKLKNKLDNYTLSTLPHSILLVGDRGSEQQEVCEYISDKFNLPLYDITDLISEEYINEIYSMPSPGLYIIDGTKFTEKDQNVLLKCFEEPNEYMYFIIWCESKYNILETIQTRSYELELDHYTREQLEQLCQSENKDLVLSIANTPGTVEELNHYDLLKLYNKCNAILEYLDQTSYYQILTVANSINFGDEYDKFPLWAFIRMLGVVILKYVKDDKLKKNYYQYVKEFNDNAGPLLDKRRYLENMLGKMWLEARYGD